MKSQNRDGLNQIDIIKDIKDLLENGTSGSIINDTIKDKFGVPPLIWLAWHDEFFPVLKSLIEKGADVNVREVDGGTSLFYAAQGHHQIFHYLIEKGADVNAINKIGDSALIVATLWTDLQTMKELLVNGANVNHENMFGKTALMEMKMLGLFRNSSPYKERAKECAQLLREYVVKTKKLVGTSIRNRREERVIERTNKSF